MLGDHYHWRKTYPYEGSSHIPYVVKWPKSLGKIIPCGTKIEQPVELRDFLPTFIDIAGGTIPSDMDGHSLLPLVQTKNPAWRKYIDLEHATCYSDDNYWCALTDGKIKYIWNFHNGSEQMFDLCKDRGETHNCIDDAEYISIREKLNRAMVEHLKERGADFVLNGQLVVREKSLLYSPNYPQSRSKNGI